MHFVARYPDKKEIMTDLIATAVEELEHFEMVYRVMVKRGVLMPKEMEKDIYVNKLVKLSRNGGKERLLDRLLIAALLEARGAERFKIVSEHVDDEDLKKFYHMLGVSEARHCHIFIRMATFYFSYEEIEERKDFFLQHEADILDSLPFRATLH